VETFPAASYAVLPGLLALIFLVRIREEALDSRRSEALRSSAAKGTERRTRSRNTGKRREDSMVSRAVDSGGRRL
jgi:hypothetical protein